MYLVTRAFADICCPQSAVEKGYWPEELFVLSGYHGMRIGCHKMADHAKDFNETTGTRFTKDSISSIPERLIAVYETGI